MRAKRLGDSMGALLCHLNLVPFGQAFSLNLNLADNQQAPEGDRDVWPHLAFEVAAGDLNSSPHVCTASALLMEACPSPRWLSV